MNHSGDAAEQIVRISLEGFEVAAKITGMAAKEIATFLAAALKNKDNKLKLKGKARMTSMLKSEKALEIFSVKDIDLQKFAQGARQYGIVYCVLRNRISSPDGLCDILVKADDAPKISRVIERFKFAKVDKAKIESKIIKTKTEKSQGMEPETPDRNDTDKLIDELLSPSEGKAQHETGKRLQKEASAQMTPDEKGIPFFQKGRKSHPSEPISEKPSNVRDDSEKKSCGHSSKPSVKEELREIKTTVHANNESHVQKYWQAPKKPKNKNITTHKHLQNNRKTKFKKTKERS